MRSFLSDTSGQQKILRVLNAVLVLCALGSCALFVLLIGWPLSSQKELMLHVLTRVVLGVFVLQEIVRLLINPHRMQHLRERKLESALAVLVLLESLFSHHVDGLISGWIPDAKPGTIALFVLAFSQLTLIGLICLRGLRRIPALASRNLTPGGALILSFALIITAGMLLLKMPRATLDGISWIDALFTSTSAVCVTGLTVLDTSQAFTQEGQLIILGLVQVGGLGIMTLTYFFAHFLTGGVSFRNRIALQDLLSEENLGQIGMVLGIIVGFTFSFELAGAAAIYWSVDHLPGTGTIDRLFFAGFHSVMSFCNAGFSTVSDGLANTALRGNVGLVTAVMLLVTAGGIGFPVVKNFWQVAVAVVRRALRLRVAVPPRLTINSRVVLVTSLCLTVGGAVFIFFSEFVFAGSDTGGLPSWLAALFHSVTARSCGFNITDTRMHAPATIVILLFLMFIGGSPASTAGGVKTSTLAVAVLALRRVLLGRAEIEAFGRRVNDETANRALAVMLLAGAFFTLVLVVLCMLHPELSTMDMAFESISAISTTGLTRGIAPLLGGAGKCVMVLAMFVGRIGVLMVLLAIMPRRPQAAFRLPEGHIVIT
ncbi:ATPase [Ereboglobus luteus]|uniref:ATPase n=1 Tax=Ereboglobus luteus TaxID=1796921 RepID=A0A2U8E4Z1_9BACT|nr:ATPase [Ereboglobus luteus]